MAVRGKYVVAWMKLNGTLKFAADTFATDNKGRSIKQERGAVAKADRPLQSGVNKSMPSVARNFDEPDKLKSANNPNRRSIYGRGFAPMTITLRVQLVENVTVHRGTSTDSAV